MTLARRLFIFTCSLLLLLCAVGASAVAILFNLRPVLSQHRAVVFGVVQLDDALAFFTGLSIAAVLIVASLALLMRRAILKRLRQFQYPLNNPGANARFDMGDELDHAAQQLNELTAAVTQLRSRERPTTEIEDARTFVEGIVHSMSDALIVTDPDMRVVTVNRAACELLQLTELEIVGRQIQEFFKEESLTISPPVAQILKDSTRDSEMVYRASNGKLISALVSASTLRDSAGRPVAIITVGKDITARKETERELLEAKIQAEAANRAKSAFIANMSHEIRTPMTAILGYADVLTRPDLTSDNRDRCIETIRRNGRHLLSIVNDILDVSKIEAGKMTVERIGCSPVQIVSDIAGLMAGRAADKNLSFSVHYSGAVPQTIQTDPTRLRQILMNLLGNAIKFTESGSVKLLVRVIEDSARTRCSMRFDVVDTGVGLDAKQIELLFRPFVQADSSTTRKFGGTGLGLTISHRLARMLGGDLTVRSVAGEGSTFSLTVEAGDISGVTMIETTGQTFEAQTAAAHASSNTIKLTGDVLLAEDGPDNRILFEYFLREIGIEVTAVENGLLARDRALLAAKNGRPFDLILMDMQMPELDGYETTRQLRAAGYTSPIVALTAHAMSGDREKCIAAGCDDFAVKPIEWEKLQAILQRFLKEAAATSPASTKVRNAPMPRSAQLDALLSRPGTAKLVENFLSKLDDRVSAIRNVVETHDAQQLRTLAHQLKGAAGGYGFPAISDAAKNIEQTTIEDAEALKDAIEHLTALCQQAREIAPMTAKTSEGSPRSSRGTPTDLASFAD
jgi:PAS domain S-box-containing protein